MNENNESIKLFRCNICNKNYSSQSSLCNHNKKFHTNSVSSIVSNVSSIVSNVSSIVSNVSLVVSNSNINKCKFCSKYFNHRSSKSRHEKYCNQNNNNKSEIIEIKKENIEIKNMLKELLQKNCKIHPKTLQKINKQLINNNSNNTTNNGTINNGPVINNTYVKFGNEQLSTLLNHKDMLKIINKQCLCIEESIKTVHFNKSLPEYNNIFITNMKDTIAYIFDGSRFILTSKDTVINDLYNTHLENIEQFLDEAEIPENKYSKITKFLDVLNDDEKSFIDGANNNKKYPNYKAYKLIAIKNLIYNESDQKLLKKLNSIDLHEKINDAPITESEE
jgi:hypothetical protein